MNSTKMLRRALLLVASAGPILTAPGAMAQFFSTQNEAGETIVVDASGQEVPIAAADPVGTKPADCPEGSYYAAETPTDSSQLVLKDCATGQSYTVQMK